MGVHHESNEGRASHGNILSWCGISWDRHTVEAVRVMAFPVDKVRHWSILEHLKQYERTQKIHGGMNALMNCSGAMKAAPP